MDRSVSILGILAVSLGALLTPDSLRESLEVAFKPGLDA